MIQKKKLLLHTCCAPCFSSVSEKLDQDYSLAVFWFNPNIFPIEENVKRLEQFSKFPSNIKIIIENSKSEILSWQKAILPFAGEREGGKRCEKCFEFRLKKTAQIAKKEKCDYFTTTLSVSPHKNANTINQMGQKIANESGVQFLEANFKKQNGYLRSLELSKQLDLYRQNYCGCIYSMKEK